MDIINKRKVKIYTEEELRNVLEEENTYSYIYLENEITLTKGITINNNKEKIIIDGNGFKFNGMISEEINDTIIASPGNKEIEFRNINIEYSNTYGVVYTPADKTYNVLVSFNNISYRGTKLTHNPYGAVKINNCDITIEAKNNIEPQEVCLTSRVIIGGNSVIYSSSTNYSLFYFKNDNNPSVVFLCKSNINISTDTKDFMTGTNRLNFTILHDTNLNITTGNGFANNPIYGVNNVLIDERATFNFIETKHQRLPMWSVYGSFTMKEGSNLELINSYENTPADNYNIYFKGSNQKIILDNPMKVVMYTRNSNILYTNNNVTFSIKGKRINMWKDSKELTSAGGIDNLPDYSWYKEDDITFIEGTINSTSTTIQNHNLSEENLKNLPDLSNFSFQERKQFSIGNMIINIHQINKEKNTISGHTTPSASILINYDGNSAVVETDTDGLFTYTLPNNIDDNTTIYITSCIPNSFIYETRKIITPFDGELSIMDKSFVFSFLLNLISSDPVILPRDKDLKIQIVDSRKTSSDWKLYAYIKRHLTSQNGFILENALIFKKLDDEIITLDNTKKLVFQGNNNQGKDLKTTITWSRAKGPLVDLSNNSLEVNEEYFSEIYFIIEE